MYLTIQKCLVKLSILSLLFSSIVWAASEKLIIISPHRKSIQTEIVPLFEKYYKTKFNKEIKVEWLDQGGTSDDVRFIKAKFASNSKTSGVDIFWGGGDSAYVDLTKNGLLQPFALPADLRAKVPTSVAGIQLSDAKDYWHASAISTFGIFYNKFLLKRLKLDEPKTWSDLASPKYSGHISTTDPRRSGSASTMNYIILDSLGWDKGWATLHAIGANTKRFTHSSSDPIKDVVSGAARFAMAIDFYAIAKVAELGSDKVGFNIPTDHSVFNPDPIAILKGAPNKSAAQEFVKYALDTEAQKVLMLPTGVAGGPKHENLGRLAVNQESYSQTEGKRIQSFNPFASGVKVRQLDGNKAQEMMLVLNDVVGTLMADLHSEMTAAWKQIQKRGNRAEDLAAFSKLPFTQAELNAYAKKWSDNLFRNQKLNEWTKFTKNKYTLIEQNKLSLIQK